MANCDRCGISNEAAPSGVLVHVDRYDREKNEVLNQKWCNLSAQTLDSFLLLLRCTNSDAQTLFQLSQFISSDKG